MLQEQQAHRKRRERYVERAVHDDRLWRRFGGRGTLAMALHRDESLHLQRLVRSVHQKE